MAIADRYVEQHGLAFLYIETMLEQYIDADQLIRVLHRTFWAKKVTGFGLAPNELIYGTDFFPPAATVMASVRDRFF